MSDIAIKVENLGKKYTIGHQRGHGSYTALRDVVMQQARTFWRQSKDLLRGRPIIGGDELEEVWALKDVNFEVRRGEAVGIIGRNGAGKSTLLKVLSRITEPSSGRVTIRGRVASLLEVGTGFHPELTGRENIYLNGAILGMSRVEIKRKFDEIVDFAGVEKYLDTPVKRYSSGMYVRLAFAVAAHLEPEILVVDEVLAVGDAEFQKKCLGKMGEVAQGGRTVLFVSHQMNAIRELCTTAMLLAQGELKLLSTTNQVIDEYLHFSQQETSWVVSDEVNKFKNPYFTLHSLKLVDQQCQAISRAVSADEQCGILIEGLVETLDPAVTVGFAVFSIQGHLLFWTLQTDQHPEEWPKLTKGKNRLVAWLPKHLLNEGKYIIEPIVSLHFRAWLVQPGVNAPAIQIEIRGGLSRSPYWIAARPGLTAPILRFEQI